MTLAPGNDVRGVDHRMSIQRPHPKTAQGAAVRIGGDKSAPEALIPGGGTVRFHPIQRLLDSLLVSPLQQLLTVQERLMVHGTLLD